MATPHYRCTTDEKKPMSLTPGRSAADCTRCGRSPEKRFAVWASGAAVEALMRQVVEAGADGMTVNFPEKLLAYGQRPSRQEQYGSACTQAYRLTGWPARAHARSPAGSPGKRHFE